MEKQAKVAREEEIKFIALPSIRQIENHIGREPGGLEEATLQRYRNAQHRIYAAQRLCAVIAAELLRPNDLKEAKWERRRLVEEAKRKYQDAALAVFSETCTKGM